MSKTAKRFTLLLFVTLLTSLAATTLLLMFLLSQRPPDHNTIRCDFSGLLFGIGWGVIILLTLSTTTVYLNLYKKIRTRRWLSLLSFFLLPLPTAAVLLALMGAITESLKEYAAIFLPYLFILCILYHRFRRVVSIRAAKYFNLSVAFFQIHQVSVYCLFLAHIEIHIHTS
ncbi:hypothetical protein [Niabella beijingensis]|uniref:hypothetical protein n=1 Tax=Niabella beijingensis TaxID=2872700 RepID=UPI001CC0127C|nr:hypothetical protein [Niabella beijingensis]MBZ4187413.1 hypothetical protein [Niabella beijingensis]